MMLRSFALQFACAAFLMLLAFPPFLSSAQAQTEQALAKGEVISLEIAAPSLKGNLLETPTRQSVTIYLPPSYNSQSRRNYPVIYILHGIFDSGRSWGIDFVNVPERLDELIAAGEIPELIAVMPDAGNMYGGGFYRNSSVSGNWEDYIVDDLIKAIDKFDPARGVDFAGYAIPTIIGELKRHFRDRTWDIRVPRRLQELRLSISEANSTLLQTLGRSPTVADIAAHLRITEEEVLEGLEGARAYNAVSLSTPTGDGERATELADMLGAEDREYELAELRVALGPALATLDEREQRILTLRFYGNLTQSQIADQIGVSQMHVSRLLARALTKLRGQLQSTY